MKTEPQEVNDQNGLLIQDATNITINIPPETDLNNPESVPSQEWDKDLCKENRYFPAEVYANLPELYRQPSLKFSEPKERDTFLVGQFGVVSGILPNVVGNYDEKDLYPNLYVYVLGPFGEGKGNLNWSKKIGDPIDQEKLAQAMELRKDYSQQIEKYNRDTKLYGQSKLTQAPEKPQLPPNLKLFITANIGKKGLLQIMQENNGRGIMFETEADTLTDAIESDHGGFSDVLRKGYAHEHLSYFRRANNEDINIALSVVLSSTYEQLKSLIPSIENCLFSRFFYYQIGSSPEFKDVFDDSKIGYNRYFTEIGQHFHKQYSFLQALSTPISFDFTPNQKKIFLEYFRAYK